MAPGHSGLEEVANEYRLLVDTIPGAVFRCEAHFPHVMDYLSVGFEALSGYPSGRLLRHGDLTYGQLIPREDLPHYRAAVAVSVASGQPYEVEHRLRHADGSMRWVLERGCPVSGPSGRPQDVRLHGVLVDVTARKQALAELDARSRDYQFLAEASVRLAAMTEPEQVFQFVREALPLLFPGAISILLRANADGSELELHSIAGLDRSVVARAGHLLGWDPEGHRFKVIEPFRDIYSRTCLHRHEEGLVEFTHGALPRPVARALQRWLSVRDIYTIGLAKGPQVFGNIHVFCTPHSQAPKPSLVESFAHQCFMALSRIHSLLELSDNEARYRMLLDATPDAVLVIQEGKYCFSNPAGLRLLGIASVDELIGTPALAPIHPDCHAEVRDRMKRAAEGTRNEAVELRVLRRDGTTVDTESTSLPISFNRRPATLIVSRDLTEQKRADQERREMERRLLHAQKLEGLGVLAGGIAHDFNNLLAAVMGNLDLLRRELPAGSPVLSCVEDSVAAARRAVSLTEQMLAYAGKSRFVVRPVDVNALVRENADFFRSSVARTVTMDVRLSPTLPLVSADPGQLQQIVMNLITNASEACGQQPGTITLSTGEQDCGAECLGRSRLQPAPCPGRYVFLEVRDTGCGMEEATQNRLFEPFFSTKFAGRGLGMAAVLGIVRAHAGAILVDSAPGRGTCIRVLFPVPESPEVTSPRGHVQVDGQGVEQWSGLVLVADDEPLVLRMAQRVLTRLGFQVITAVDGVQAVELFRQHAQELACVILDLTMPNMDGHGARLEMQKVQPHVPVILSTGLGASYAHEQFQDESFAGFIQKPYDLKNITDTLRKVLGPPSGRR